MSATTRADHYRAQTGTRAHWVDTIWKGDTPGQSGVACSCGDELDGFASIAEAEALMEPHIATSGLTSRQRRRYVHKLNRSRRRAA